MMFSDELQQDLASLDATLVAYAANRNDRATLLIKQCLDRGAMTGSELIDRLCQLGLNRRHVGIRLEKDKGWRWRRTDDGHYHPNP